MVNGPCSGPLAWRFPKRTQAYAAEKCLRFVVRTRSEHRTRFRSGKKNFSNVLHLLIKHAFPLP